MADSRRSTISNKQNEGSIVLKLSLELVDLAQRYGKNFNADLNPANDENTMNTPSEFYAKEDNLLKDKICQSIYTAATMCGCQQHFKQRTSTYKLNHCQPTVQ